MVTGSTRSNRLKVKHNQGWTRHFEGWQAGLFVIGCAALVFLLLVPRPVFPDAIPLPTVNVRTLQRVDDHERELARRARLQPLPLDVRVLGERLREYGLADAGDEHDEAVKLLTAIGQQVPVALRAGGPELVLQLRAAQAEVFLEELRRFEKDGVETKQLREIGGGMIALARRGGWLRPKAQGFELVASDTVRRILFRKRWNELTGLGGPPFTVDLEQERALHAFLFAHPVIDAAGQLATVPQVRCDKANEYLLRKVETFGSIDPSYPTDYARGLLMMRLGRPRQALMPLARYVEKEDGPYMLRARNALREAQERTARGAP